MHDYKKAGEVFVSADVQVTKTGERAGILKYRSISEILSLIEVRVELYAGSPERQ